ncbi:hypothetical protein QVD17_23202 [Tagetes erecta]|uniref:Uncharacterized protein n=1 Tax=Tagetes erecta TaxID=13708 RepID=A0AAD8KGV3_TARER|nr:hypothetical protein QVD17_23202 [Tagetes erecta]
MELKILSAIISFHVMPNHSFLVFMIYFYFMTTCLPRPINNCKLTVKKNNGKLRLRGSVEEIVDSRHLFRGKSNLMLNGV